jgi:outer membrane protein assembly factor BamB
MIGMRVLLLSLLMFALSAARGLADLADQVRASGIQGGLVVHVGCGDGKQTAKLLLNDRFCVHGLDADPADVQKARKHIRSAGIYGKVSVSLFDGKRLPYVDDLVNLIVASGECQVAREEILRVLTPGGVCLLLNRKSEIANRKWIKPWPEDIDNWNHHLHGSDNNAVALDNRVSTPRHIQWVCGPLWSRSHEFLSSISGMISDGGRLFYFCDEGLTGTTDPPVPERWKLIARDAFNGKLLWKRAIEEWGTRGWRSKALRATDRMAPRRLVAGDGRLFVTLGFTAPVSMLDAATGEILSTIEGTEHAQELRYLDGVLVLRKNKGPLLAIDAASGDRLWETKGNIRAQMIAASSGMVFYQDGLKLHCRVLEDGRELWQVTEKVPVKQLLVHDNYLVVAGATIKALEADTGKTCWELNSAAPRHQLFAVNGQLWISNTTGLDLTTGKAKTKVEGTATVFSAGHHPRCYPAKATQRFMITPFRGTEFISITGGEHTQNDWLRGPCTFGVLPCNGLLYVAPNPCFCYPGVKMTGFNAFAGSKSGKAPQIPDAERLQKGPAYGLALDTGPSTLDSSWPTYRHDGRRSGSVATDVPARLKECWSADLGGRLTQPVVVSSSSSGSGPGVVYVASRDTHTLYALDRQNGRELWTYTADGRIDSPPTVLGDLILFGSAHGQVHCLRATDGELVWRFRAAPTDQLMMAFDQLESPWRVHGSVLVEKGVAYFTAGRSTNLDGGIRVYGLDPASGSVLHKRTLNTWSRTRKDAENKPFVPAYHMEGALSDILASEGGFIYLGQYKLDRALEEQEVPYILPDPDKKSTAMGRTELVGAPFVEGVETMEKDEQVQRDWQLRNHRRLMEELERKHGRASLGDRKMGRHLFATGGMLDDSWFNRTFWMYSETWPGFYIAHRAAKTGQLLSVDEEKTYAVQAYPSRNLQSPLFTPDKHGYLLFADDNDNEPVLPEYTRNVPKGIGFTREKPPVWFRWVPVRIRAMVAANSALFFAGPPDVLDPNDPMASFDGRKGAVLWVVSKDDGEKLAEYKLDCPPVFDGMAAADGRLYLSTLDGKVTCLGR